MNALNAGLKAFRDDINKDPLAKRRLEIAIVTFDNEIKVAQDFVTADQFQPPTLVAGGQTYTGSGILKALEILEARKAQYRQHGVPYYRPWIFMVTDGEPQGEPDSVIERARQDVQAAEKANRVAFFAVGVEGANMEKLRDTVVRPPVKLIGLNFTEMFIWLSKSTQAVSKSKTSDTGQVALPPPGWGTV